MGVLQSKLFTEGNQATVDKLENCATGEPNEVQSHFALGQSGEHIKRVQEALQSVQQSNPSLGIPPFSVTGVYDQKFADAVRAYKAKRDIKNFSGKIDDIIGIKTIRRLDQENKSGPPKNNPTPPAPPKKPGEFPRPLSNCVTDADCPSAREFDVTVVAGVSGGEVVEVGKFFLTIRDTINGFSAIYVLKVAGLGISILPVGVAGGGSTKHFTTGDPVRVTRFGPFGSIAGINDKPVVPVPVGLLVLGFRPDGKVARPTAPMTIDTGPIEIPGASIHAGQLKIISICNGQPGATRRVLGALDVPGD